MDFELNELQGTVPVEGWAQVVSQHLMRHGTFHLLKVGKLGLVHMNQQVMSSWMQWESFPDTNHIYTRAYIYIYTLYIYIYM